MNNDFAAILTTFRALTEGTERDEFGREKDDNIQYVVEPTKVIAQLQSYRSQSYTKLAQKIGKISTLEIEIKALKEEVKQDTRELIADLFAADDAAKTRVVETLSFIFTMSKDPKPTETVAYAKVIEALTEQLTPELIVVLESLKEKFKSTTQKPPSLKINPVESIVREGAWDSMKSFAQKVFSWGKKYDQKLDVLRRIAIIG